MRLQHFSANRWLIFAPVAIFALFAPQANAEPIAGLQTTYYTIDSVPPTRSDNIYTECGSEVENNINRSYDGEPYLDCTNDLFMVHMTGFITIPEHTTIEFWLASDDGGTIDIGGNEWGNWNDQGCSATESGQIDISAGSHSLDLWMYENGGGTCIMLAWNINDQGWSIVPDEAFTTTGIPTDTTVPDTTIPDTTIQETTTTWETTTTSTTSTTTTTTSTIAPSTTVAVTPNLTTTTLQTTTSVASISETTLPTIQLTTPATMPLVEYPTTTILLEPTTTFPDSLPEVVATVPYATVQPTYTLPLVIPTLPDVIQATIPDIPVEPPTSLPDATETLDTVNVPFTTFPEDTPLLPALSDAEFEAVLDDLKDALPDEVTAIVTTLLTTEVTSDQAVQVVSSVEVLAVISGEQAQQLFDAVDESALTVEEQTQIVEAIADAPTEVKEAFENEINIFGGEGFDEYVPVDSNVSVAVRRTIIVGTTILVAMPSPVARRNSL
jgi:hypothetical protein